MSNPNKLEINKQYGDMVRASLVNTNNSNSTTASNAASIAYDNSTKLVSDNVFSNISDSTVRYDKLDAYTTLEVSRNLNNINENTCDTVKIKDIEILVPNKVVKVTFMDDTFEKAVCHEEDNFNLEIAITICIAKRLLGGSGKFNNIVEKGLKLLENKIKAKEEAKREEERIKNKIKKLREKKLKRLERKKNEEREARIQETAEAIARAHEIVNNKPNKKEN